MDLINKSVQFPNIISDLQIDPKARTWIEINKSAVLHNLNEFRSIVGPNVNLAVVAKSNAYGHDLPTIAKICQESPQANWLCVFSLYEALVARKSGFEKPILVLGHIDVDVLLAILQEIDLTVFDLDFILKLNEIAKKLKMNAFVHIKIDTGLSRLGVVAEHAFEFIKKVYGLSNIKIRGIFSHFSESDANDQSFTQKQLERFSQLLNKLKESNINIPFIHSSNTTGIIRFDSCHFNFVRTGGGTYGLYISSAFEQLGEKKHAIHLKLAMTWKSRIMQIKELPVGTYVSYARTFVTYRPTRIGIIPIGYWDGYSRNLSNKGLVYIKNLSVPVIGRVCMNMIMIDITDIQNVEVQDEVILLGDKPGITPNDLAQQAGSINYEITTRINPSISRIIV